MPTICFANPKGGCGKTTSCLLLAEQMALSGYKLVIIDCDPNENVLHWAGMRSNANKTTPFEVLKGSNEDEMLDFIENVQKKYELVLLDMEGTASQTLTYALSLTDLCIVPFEPTPMETRQAARMIKFIKTTSKMIGRNIEFSLAFSRTNAAFQTSDEKDVRSDLGDIPVLNTVLVKRAAFTRIFRDGELLSELPYSVSNVPKAVKNAKSFAADILNIIKG